MHGALLSPTSRRGLRGSPAPHKPFLAAPSLGAHAQAVTSIGCRFGHKAARRTTSYPPVVASAGKARFQDRHGAPQGRVQRPYQVIV